MRVSGISNNNSSMRAWEAAISSRNAKARMKMHSQIAESMYRKYMARLQKEIWDALNYMSILGKSSTEKESILKLKNELLAEVREDCLEEIGEIMDDEDDNIDASFKSTEQGRALELHLRNLSKLDILNITNEVINKLDLAIHTEFNFIEVGVDIEDTKNRDRRPDRSNIFEAVKQRIIEATNKRLKEKSGELALIGITEPIAYKANSSDKCDQCGRSEDILIKAVSDNHDETCMCSRCAKDKLEAASRAALNQAVESTIEFIQTNLVKGYIDPARIRVEMQMVGDKLGLNTEFTGSIYSNVNEAALNDMVVQTQDTKSQAITERDYIQNYKNDIQLPFDRLAADVKLRLDANEAEYRDRCAYNMHINNMLRLELSKSIYGVNTIVI